MFMIIFSFIILFIFFIIMNNNMYFLVNLSNNFNMNLEMNLNNMNMIFSLVILLISLGVLFYSKFYFNFVINNSYKINLMIFIMSMVLLVNGNNMILMLIGWDGLGISSFYLISFYSNMESSISSLITFFFNRLGDSMMLMFSSMLLNTWSSVFLLNFNMIMLTILFLGLITKSSQIPFGVWLPMAMSAPTPISSLVHSSTLVTAGIVVMMKMDYLFFIKEFQIMIVMFSLMTFTLGGLFSFSINDMKKSIAFSTLSQLGFILFSISLGNSYISFSHMIYHAFFKSSLFINLGFFMNYNNYAQDQRLMFNFSFNYIFKLTFIISCMNLMGLISTSGFLSKDMILILFNNSMLKIIIFVMLYLGCLITVLYSMKFILCILNKNLMNYKMMMKMKLNFFFMWFIFSSFILILIPMMFSEFLMLNMNNFSNNNYKILFYMIIMISITMMKLIFNYMNFMMMVFSKMIMLVELMNKLLSMKFSLIMKNLIKLMFYEEFMQYLLLNIISYSSNNIYLINKLLIFKMEIFMSMLLLIMINKM